MAAKKRTILRTEKFKAFYVLDMQGTQKIVKAVNEVDLTIDENEIYGIAGESGCGKTTLLKALFSAIDPPLRLIGGKIFLPYQLGQGCGCHHPKPGRKAKLRMEYISYVPQGSMSVLNPVLKAERNLSGFHWQSRAASKARKKSSSWPTSTSWSWGYPKISWMLYPHQLSGGMRQRVTIALAALFKPRIMIGDEPTTALDVVVQRGVIQLLKTIQKNFKNTIILVTHDMGVHANIADRIGIMYAGKIVEEATHRADL